MSVAMRLRLLELVVRAARNRLVIFGGIGDTSYAHSRELGQGFLRLGTHAVVANLPSYYPLTAPMMTRYFTQLADEVNCPLYLYNIPQTTKQSIPIEVIEQLSSHQLIAGVKDSEPDAARQVELCQRFAGRNDFAVFGGSIALTSQVVRAGADGCVPGGGNFVPALLRALMDKLLSGDVSTGDAAQQRVDAVNAIYQKGRTITQLFIALKAIMEIYGICGRSVLPPMIRATDAEVDVLRKQLRELGLPG
jgi:4-hydroxy-tetrahydrodipicolinate synthase